MLHCSSGWNKKKYHEEEITDPLVAAVVLVVGPDCVNEIDDVFHLGRSNFARLEESELLAWLLQHGQEFHIYCSLLTAILQNQHTIK